MKHKYISSAYLQHFLSVVVLLISISVSLFAGELAVRLILPEYNPSGMVQYKVLSDGTPVISKSNAVLRQWKEAGDYDVSIYSNALGLRNRKSFETVSDNAWYVVGDSFSFGHGVEEEDRYSNLLEKLGVDGDVVNVSIPTDINGYDKLLLYAKKNGAKINNLIIGICMENDLFNYDDIGSEKKIVYEESFFQEKFLAVKDFLFRKSALYNLTTYIISKYEILHTIATKTGLITKNIPLYKLPDRDQIASTVQRLVKLRESQGLDPIILIIPSRSLWAGLEKEAADEVHKYFTALLLIEKFNIVDPRLSFEKSGHPLQYHFVNDGHWNVEGHKLTAKLLHKYIHDRKINSPKQTKAK
jgi:hypothetical protein